MTAPDTPASPARIGAAAFAALIAGLIVFCVTSVAPRLLDDGDTYWHLAAGGLMLDQGRVPTTDPFSYTFGGQPWTAHEWLSEVLMALAYRAAGWSGLCLLFAAAAGGAAAMLAGHVRRHLAPIPAAAVTALALMCVAANLLARPHILALPVLAAWTLSLIRARDRGAAPSLWLLPLMVLWANLHGSFVLGLALIGPFALEALIENRKTPWPTIRSWGIFGVAAVVAATLTPHGLHGLIFPFQLMGLDSTALIAEWDPIDFSEPGPFLIALAALVFVGLWKGLKVPPLRLILLLGLIYMSLVHSRHQMVAAVVGAMVLAEPLSRVLAAATAPERPLGRTPVLLVAGLALLAVAAIRISLPVERADGLTTPMTALGKAPAELRGKPVFNDYGFGGYLISQGVKPFVDGRADLYGDAFMRDYSRANRGDPAALKATLERYGVAWTLLNPDTPAVAALDAMPGWRRLYADAYGVIHIREAVALPGVQPAPKIAPPDTSAPAR